MRQFAWSFYFFCSALRLVYAEEIPTQKVEAVVLGGGAAGLTSAIYLSRAGFSTLVVEGPVPGGAITQSGHVYNWPGFKEISGFELMDHIRLQAESAGAVVSKEELVQASLSETPFSFLLQDVYEPSKKRKILADTCIIAMGAAPRKLEVPGEAMYASKGVYTCAVCDGALYKGKTVGIVGGGDGALAEAEYLAGLAKKVYVFNRKGAFKGIEKNRQERLLAMPNVEFVYQVSVKEILGNGESVEAVLLKGQDGKETKVLLDAVFLAIGATPNTKFFEKQLVLDPLGYLSLKNGCETSLPGVFAAGDVADPKFKQAVVASGEGAKAAMQATDYLHGIQEKGKLAALPGAEKKEPTPVKAVEVTTLSELKKLVSDSSKLVLVDFYATWCGPCRYLGKFTDGWAQELEGKAIVCKVNVDVGAEIASLFHVRSMPTVVAINSEGREVARKVGVEEIVGYIEKLKKQHSK